MHIRYYYQEWIAVRDIRVFVYSLKLHTRIETFHAPQKVFGRKFIEVFPTSGIAIKCPEKNPDRRLNDS